MQFDNNSEPIVYFYPSFKLDGNDSIGSNVSEEGPVNYNHTLVLVKGLSQPLYSEIMAYFGDFYLIFYT